jgi:hypothetical protein
MSLQKWVKLPTAWITQKRVLPQMRWTTTPGEGANNMAALMTLIVIAQHADPSDGVAALTYDQLGECTGLSRAKLSGGLKLLEKKFSLVERRPSGRSSFRLADFDPTGGWGKLPARRLYSPSGRISFFSALGMRKPAELHALKLYLLFVAMRDNASNLARISYDRIEEYTGVDRHQIRSALSILAANGVVHIEHLQAWGDHGISNAYRVAFIEDHQHLGTTLRGRLPGQEPDAQF